MGEMNDTMELLKVMTNLPLVAMVLARVGGLVIFVPFFASTSIPAKTRIMLSLAITIIVLPFVPVLSVAKINDVGGLVVMMFSELMIGLAIGFIIMTVFSGLQLAGLMIGQQLGIALARVFDPLFNEQSSVLGQFYFWLAMIIFLLINGHIILLKAIINSFRTLGPGQFVASKGFVNNMGEVLQLSFAMAFQVSAPVIVAILLTTLAMGFITRTVPQFNILSVGFSIRAVIGFVLVVICLIPAMHVFLAGLDMGFDMLYRILGL